MWTLHRGTLALVELVNPPCVCICWLLNRPQLNFQTKPLSHQELCGKQSLLVKGSVFGDLLSLNVRFSCPTLWGNTEQPRGPADLDNAFHLAPYTNYLEV